MLGGVFFFKRGIWTYNTETVFRGNTSWLNFIPWGLGGFVYYIASSFSGITVDYIKVGLIFFPTLLSLIIAQIFFFKIFIGSQNNRFSRASLRSLLFVYFPILGAFVLSANVFGARLYLVAIVLGIFACLMEYIFGKICEFFLSKRLWNYTYLSIDRGHFSPLSIPLFSVAGFLFMFIATALQHLMVW